jgi:hypothetical protein
MGRWLSSVRTEIAGKDESAEKILKRPHGELTKLTKPFSPVVSSVLSVPPMAISEKFAANAAAAPSEIPAPAVVDG